MSDILMETPPTVQFALFGYDLRGTWVLEFSVLVSEGHDSGGGEWDRPEWRHGELWHGDERVPIPWFWALPWASEVAEILPSRRMWLKDSA